MRTLGLACTMFALVYGALVLQDIWINEERYFFYSHIGMIGVGILLCGPWLFRDWLQSARTK